MNLTNLLDGYRPYEGIIKNLDNTPISVAGIAEHAQLHLIASMLERTKKNVLIVTYSDMESKVVCKDLKMYTDKAVVFPGRDYVFYNIDTMGRENENARLFVLDKILQGGVAVVASVDALMSYTADIKRFKNGIKTLSTGDGCDIESFAKELTEMGYSREEVTESVGQFSVRGGILDVFPPGSDNPCRIELWGDEIDSVRTYDAQSQRTLDTAESVRIIPATEVLYSPKRRDELILELKRRVKSAEQKKEDMSEYIRTLNADAEAFAEGFSFPSVDKYISLIYGYIPSVTDYFSEDTLAFVIDPKRVCERMNTFLWERGEELVSLKNRGLVVGDTEDFYKTAEDTVKALSSMRLILLEMLSHTKNSFTPKTLEVFSSKTTVSFHGKLDYLFVDLEKYKKDGYSVVVLGATNSRVKNLEGVFKGRNIDVRISEDGEFEKGETVIIRGGTAGGFEYPEIKFVLLSEQEIFKTAQLREKRRRDNVNRIKSYNDINIGDYVVHSAHGIGEYAGIKKMTVGAASKDYLKILYRDGDVLYVPVEQMNLLYKYGGKSEDKTVKLNRLGTQEWSKTKRKVKAATDELAKGLIKLYAEREKTQGFAFSEDTLWQREFEDSFGYFETNDQLRSIEEVKADMEKSTPMDRLLCGDVGFGKTEVALRAAFKAVCDSKQVVYLCPTTILAMQHYETFSSRMADYPVTVEMLSRFRTAKEQKEIIKKLADGRIDIIIGTHRLLSDDIKYKNLGLLIVDEEQRFGVGHKEKIKEIKTNVDVLTMTATPIPRTLHMAMTSVRDMSILSQPPGNRYPVQTYVLEYNETVVFDAIRKELSRGGQVFYLYNRVRGIYHIAQRIKDAFPEAEIAVGHGKMNENELEDIMYDMVSGKTQILVCTTIIETGLDIPNANTIIIEDADRMGLSQLYQLRGRVGRSNRAAYAYLTYRKDKVLSSQSQKRLAAIREFTEFGSGFKIAMRDLEIRGAGNILGPQQHGHMDNVGYDMYCKILQTSIDEARGESNGKTSDVAIDISINAYIPENYIPSANQRVDMYKKIAAISDSEDEMEICDELIDRYGDIPKSVMNIIAVAALKPLARDTGCIEITERQRKITLKFEDGYLTPEVIFGLDKKLPQRVKVISAENPAVSVSLLEKDRNILEFVNKLLNFIKELQNTNK